MKRGKEGEEGGGGEDSDERRRRGNRILRESGNGAWRTSWGGCRVSWGGWRASLEGKMMMRWQQWGKAQWTDCSYLTPADDDDCPQMKWWLLWLWWTIVMVMMIDEGGDNDDDDDEVEALGKCTMDWLLISAGHLFWIYRQLIGMSYIALARQVQTYRNISDPLGRLGSW